MSLFDRLCSYIVKCAVRGRAEGYKRRLDIPSTVTLGAVTITGYNVVIGVHTYFNSGYIASSKTAKVSIGKWCAIGYNVSIVAVSHDINFPTGPEDQRPAATGNIEIGDGVWIGNNVTIVRGVKIGDFSVIGANAVVTSDIPAMTVCAGIPCRMLYVKDAEKCARHINFVSNH